MSESRRDLVLVNLGTPAAPTPTAVRAFLREFLSDPMVVDKPGVVWKLVLNGIILRVRPKPVARMYASIWHPDGSPLAVGTRRITRDVAALRGELGRTGYAFRYGAPGIEGALRDALASGAGEVRVLPLFPHRTGSVTGTVEKLVGEIAERLPHGRERVSMAALPPDDPDYVEALAARARDAFEARGRPEKLVVSFHGIPVRYDESEGGRYRADARATTAALLAALDWDPADARQTWQSRFGREPWLAPDTEATIVELAKAGCRSVAVTCPGFLTEGLETLEEIAERGREAWIEAGGPEDGYVYVPAVEGHPALARALARVADGESPAR